MTQCAVSSGIFPVGVALRNPAVGSTWLRLPRFPLLHAGRKG